MTGDRPEPRLLILPSLAYGGMERQLIDLARALRERGGRATILAGDGPLADEAREVAEVELIDWSRPAAETAARAVQLARGAVVALPADPLLMHLLEPLAGAAYLHVAVHGRPGALESWFGPHGTQLLGRVVPELYDDGRATFTASSVPNGVEHARRLGLPPGAMPAWLPGVAGVPASAPATGPVRRVTVVVRLSPEKLAMVAAGAELVAAGLDAGADVTLDVYGEGPAEDAVRRLLAQRLPEHRFRLLGPATRPLEVAGAADAVVNAGRAAIEALMLGRRVVTPLVGPGGRSGVGPAVRPDNFAVLKERNFVWQDEPRDPRRTWEEMTAITADDLRVLSHRARNELSSEALLDGHLAALARGAARRKPAARPARFAAREATGVVAAAVAYRALVRAGVREPAAAGGAASVAALNAGAWHRRTTFRDGRLRGPVRRRFWAVQAGGAGLTVGAARLLAGRLDVSQTVAQAASAVPVAALVLYVNRLWTFR
jgi:putative flippase GtrA